jgi:hypothetical protein
MMELTIDLGNYAGDAKGLIYLLHSLKNHNSWSPTHEDEIEKVTCRTPSSALKYTGLVMKDGISTDAEKVFLKNPGIGVRYLIRIKKKAFSDPETQKKFWKKVLRDPQIALAWAQTFGRLSEVEEEVFLKNTYSMRNYAYFVIKGKFPERIHNMILLKSYEEMSPNSKKYLSEYIKYTS